jgi:hypothetical protein
MTILGLIVAPIVIIGGWFITKEFWLLPTSFSRIWLPVVAGLLVLGCYLLSAAIRSRGPMLAVGGLKPDEDDKRVDSFLQMRVENLGPGKVRPIVKLTYLRKDDGGHLPIAVAYLGQEIHWRHFNTTDKDKYLDEGDEAYAGVFWLRELDSDAPEILIYPITLNPQHIWPRSTRLEDQSRLRVKITIRCRYEDGSVDRESRAIKRSYLITPDRSQSLRYKARRVWIRHWFWS